MDKFNIYNFSLSSINLGHVSELKFVGIKNNYLLIQLTTPNKKITVSHNTNVIQEYLIAEIINNSPLWSYQFINNDFSIKLKFYIDLDLVDEYLNKSLALGIIIENIYNSTKLLDYSKYINNSYIPDITPFNPNNLKIDLYEYQKKSLAKMIDIEKSNGYMIPYTLNLNIESINFLYNPIINKIVDNDSYIRIKTTGGILADEMGLGKTITTIALIANNPPINIPNKIKSEKLDCDKIFTKVSLIICPSHLAKQWETEIKKVSNLKCLTIISKVSHQNLTVSDFINSDVIITTFQFLTNFKYYPTLYYRDCTPATFDHYLRNRNIKECLEYNIENYRELLFEFFYFHRIIIDEGHELFADLFGNYSLNKYISTLLLNLDSNYNWYISGTPFINKVGITTCNKFINFTMKDEEFNFKNDIVYNTFINKEYIWDRIFDIITIRHRKEDIQNQINIPSYEEEIHWINLTDLERELYNSKLNRGSEYLQQLCCHPLILENNKQIVGNIKEVSLSIIQDKLIQYHKDNYDNYINKLNNLDTTNQAYHMIKKKYETQINESKYLITILEKLKEPETVEDNCVICLDQINNPVLTDCGHLFCYECIKKYFSIKKACPLCKVDLTAKDLLIVNEKNIIQNVQQKYGSKLGKLIQLINQILLNPESRIIIFSQWDDMLSLIAKTLSDNNIYNCSVKGNYYSRNSAINKFKSGDNSKVIMLSLKNNASGINLTEASHIFFVEPVNLSRENSKSIENQAIARACRLGQKNTVKLIRILVRDTIEEIIFNRYYK